MYNYCERINFKYTTMILLDVLLSSIQSQWGSLRIGAK